MKKMLSCHTLHTLVRDCFLKIKDTSKRTCSIKLADVLMSGYAVFSLKFPSLLQFDTSISEKVTRHNIKSVFQIDRIPSDTQMRERLDKVSSRSLRYTYKKLFAQLQRSGKLEFFKYLDKYLICIDGTGYYHSKKVHCDNCCEKNHKDGSKSFYHQILVGSLVHPDHKEVFPLAPESIMKTDGAKKNDCETCAAKRVLAAFKREHPHIKPIITGDSLFSTGVFIKQLQEYNYSYILMAKPKNHTALFEEFNALEKSSYEITRDSITHKFAWVNDIAINDSHLDCKVNVLEYKEKDKKGKETTWVTDIPLCKDNVFKIMRGGRARHKIENETFNTLKNQEYNFEHNFGHGNKYLSEVFASLMMLAFFVDQLQQFGCKKFTQALTRFKSKKMLWGRKLAIFLSFCLDSLDDLWNALAYGYSSTVVINTS
jgi:hypothetical protein